MRFAESFRPDERNPRLLGRRRADRTEWWTETVGREPPVYGERWAEADGRVLRAFEPARSKLSAGVVKGWTGPLPAVGERWLYLGAASGTTASHLADLVGPSGLVLAVERSLRPFARLIALAERWPNLVPILADARTPARYESLVPPVHGVYADVAQPDQVAIVRANADTFLAPDEGAVLLALKTASMGRWASPADHVREAETELGSRWDLEPSLRLDPFHRGHYLLGGVRAGTGRGRPRPTTPRRAVSRSRGRRRW